MTTVGVDSVSFRALVERNKKNYLSQEKAINPRLPSAESSRVKNVSDKCKRGQAKFFERPDFSNRLSYILGGSEKSEFHLFMNF